MKTLLLATTLSLSVFAGTTIVPVDEHLRLSTDDVAYIYNFTEAKCQRTTYNLKKAAVTLVRSRDAMIDEKFVNRAGTIYQLSFENENHEEKVLILSNTFGGCKAFQDIVIKGLNVNLDQYVGMKPTK